MIESLSEQLLDQIADRVGERLLTGNMRANQAHIGDLQSRYEEFTTEHDFKPGQLVRWKPGLRNRRSPDYGEAGIVISLLTEPVYDSNPDSGSPYFREPLDILIAILDDDGEFLVFYYDKRRFEPVRDRS